MALMFIGSLTFTFIFHKYNNRKLLKEEINIPIIEKLLDKSLEIKYDPLFYVTVFFKTKTLIMYKFIRNTSEALVLFDLIDGEILSFKPEFNTTEQYDFCSTILHELTVKHPHFEAFYYIVNPICPLSLYMKNKGEIIYYGLIYFHSYIV